MRNKQKMISNRDKASEIIPSGWGNISYSEWCDREVLRLDKMGVKARKVVIGDDCFVERV